MERRLYHLRDARVEESIAQFAKLTLKAPRVGRELVQLVNQNREYHD